MVAKSKKKPLGMNDYRRRIKRTKEQKEALVRLLVVAAKSSNELLHMQTLVSNESCGTVRCLAGYCIVDPWMRRHTLFGRVPKQYCEGGWPDEMAKRGSEYVGALERLSDVFGLTKTDALFLFAAHGFQRGPTIDVRHPVSRAEVLDRVADAINGLPVRPYKNSDSMAEDDNICRKDLPPEPAAE